MKEKSKEQRNQNEQLPPTELHSIEDKSTKEKKIGAQYLRTKATDRWLRNISHYDTILQIKIEAVTTGMSLQERLAFEGAGGAWGEFDGVFGAGFLRVLFEGQFDELVDEL